jgi:hypothetical protein
VIAGSATLVLMSANCGSPSSPALGVAKASIVKGLPIPHEALLAQGSAATYMAWYVVPDAGSLANLNSWYEEQFKAGRPWRAWTACPSPNPVGSNGSGESWRWQQVGSDGVTRELVLSTLENHGRVGIDMGVTGAVPPEFHCP